MALLLGLISSADAQQHRATRLGDPAHRFARPLQKPEDLRALFRDPKLRADVESVLRQADWPGDVEDLRKAAATAEIVAVQIPTGTRLPFMSTRRQGKPVALIDVLWAGKEPFAAYEFDFVSKGRRYRCLTPKPCANFLVLDLGPQAAMELSRSVPPEVSLCEPFDLVVAVRNTGGATLTDVRVDEPLLRCFRTVEGQTPAALEAGTLQPGERKEFRLRLKAAEVTTCSDPARGSSAQGANADAAGSVAVKAPVVTMACTAPATVLQHRPAQVCLTVKNTGTAPEPKAVVSLPIPAGAAVSEITEGGAASDGRVVWTVADLAPGTERKLCATFTQAEPGGLTLTSSVTCACAPPVESRCETQVAGIPAILLEVEDLEDPVEVGHPVTYEIRVTNQGSAVLTNVKLLCTLPDTQEYVSGEGVTPVKAQERTVTSEAYPRLEPKAKVSWRVVVRALREADARFKVELSSDQFQRPVEEYEATSQY